MQKLSPKELKAIKIIRGIKGYKILSEEKLLSALIASKSVKKGENNFDDTKPQIIFLNQE